MFTYFIYIFLNIVYFYFSSPQNYSEWLRGFEKKAKECVTGTSGSEEVKVSLRSEISVLTKK